MSSHRPYPPEAEERLLAWFDHNGWTPSDFQRSVWQAYNAGESGLLDAPTGTGKTLAVWGAALIEWLAEAAGHGETADGDEADDGLEVLWITPLRALSTDTVRSLSAVVDYLDIPWSVEARTGDTSYQAKKRHLVAPPSALVTTPESLSVMLSYPESEDAFSSVKLIVVDEWHELLSSKRGTQTELGLARLRRWAPAARIWGLSATVGNPDVALDALVGTGPTAARPAARVSSRLDKEIAVDALLPEDIHDIPWAGHIGLTMLDRVVEELDSVANALVFTNTRNQAERWYRALLDARPSWAGEIALHYGSLARKQRRFVERALDEGRLRCVVCTSTLDLGVDFAPVERVFQVGSPKGVGRILQRAGRSGHQPGAVSRVTGIPSHALQLVEYAAARSAGRAKKVEDRTPIQCPLDLLVQHIVTIAIGGGFRPDDLFDEVRSAHAYADLSRTEWDWAVAFAATGGESLSSYERYQRITKYDGSLEDVRGMFVGTSDELARRHRMMIGTIVSDSMVEVKYTNGHSLGTVEESFVSRLRKGDRFSFAGKTLEYVRIEDMKVIVRKAHTSEAGTVPRWLGGSLPLSTELARWIRIQLAGHGDGRSRAPEMRCIRPILDVQRTWSLVPGKDDLLIERAQTREGHHVFLFPFEGRRVHEGMALLLAYRLSRAAPSTYTLAYNDYGLELLSPEPAPIESALQDGLFDSETLAADLNDSLNASEMARRHFREIARVAGLVFTGYPGNPKALRHIQASAGLIFDVLERHEPDHPLLEQAYREVRERQLDEERLHGALERAQAATLHVVDVPQLTPLAFPLFVNRLQQRISSEKLADRVRRMQMQFEEALANE